VVVVGVVVVVAVVVVVLVVGDVVVVTVVAVVAVVVDVVDVVAEVELVFPVPVDVDSGAIAFVCSEVARADPFLLVDVTIARMVEPTSLAVNLYPCEVAPAMVEHERPLPLQRAH
jgi:hypothetical protein